MTVLLDANLLIALAVVDHVHHEPAEAWFTDLEDRFATCPITQGALVRLAVRLGATARDAVEVLISVTSHPDHELWGDEIGFDQVDLAGVVGHRQVTDAYLAGLAAHRGGQLATLDQGLAALRPGIVQLVRPATTGSV